MTNFVSRRSFLAVPAALVTVPASAAPSAERMVSPFLLKQVRLLDGPFREGMQKNSEYLYSLEPDRLLHTFRLNVGLPSTAKPLGGWEFPSVELRGHFMGHYLSGCALMFAATGDEKIRARANGIVAELAKCQAAAGNGYLSAFPTELLDRLRDGKKVWAPWYTLHKIMAGLFDMYELCGNQQALEVLRGMAAWTKAWSDPLSAEHFARILQEEHGGMVEVLCDLYAVTKDPMHLKLAQRFDHERVIQPLAEGRDQLKGLHANTTIPKINGAAREYELTGDIRYRKIAEYFWRQVTGHRCYCTGGTSNFEHWKTDPDKLASELSADTQECCCTYNMLKLTRHVFSWTADASCGDYYERALFNSVLGTMNPSDGLTMYFIPLASGYWKLYGRPTDSFWCCTGTGVESFSKFADSIYFHNERELYVNLFIASELNWTQKGLRVRQVTGFPAQGSTQLLFETAKPVKLSVRIRVPYWADKTMSITVNGKALKGSPTPSSYWTIDRTWKNGDKVDVQLPMRLHVQPMPDDGSMQAIMWGPLVLAGDLGKEGLTPEMQHGDPGQKIENHSIKSKPIAAPALQVTGKDIHSWIKPLPKPLVFRTAVQDQSINLVPLYKIVDQRYAVYWKIKQA